MRCRGFKLEEIKRPNGSLSWRVSGSINGSQVRKQFATLAEAQTFQDQQNAILFERGPLKSPVRTHLTADQIKEAETVFALLQESPTPVSLLEAVRFHQTLGATVTREHLTAVAAAIKRLADLRPGSGLTDTIDYYLTHFRPPLVEVALRAALEEYLLERKREHEKRSLGYRQFSAVGRELARLERHFTGPKPIASFTEHDLHEYLLKTSPVDSRGTPTFSNKTWNNRRGLLTTFFSYCQGRGWLTENPAQRLKAYRRSQLAQGDVAILRADQAEELMRFVETFQGGRLVPFFALTLFAGVRPDWQHGEISKIGPGNFVLVESYLRLPKTITKTKKKRHTQLQPNLIAWLTKYPLEHYPIICANFKKLYPKIRQKFGLKHDVLRHTYCSMLVGQFRSVSETALQAGNSEKVLWESYLDLVDKKEAERFWAIAPRAGHPSHAPLE